MNAFEYGNELWNLFTNDEALVKALNVDVNDESSYSKHYRQDDVAPELFNVENLPFVAFYFADAGSTANDYLNLGLLRVDIYASYRDDVEPIRKRIVELIHERFDERIRAEGQRSSGITNVYKYRLEFTPLIFTLEI